MIEKIDLDKEMADETAIGGNHTIILKMAIGKVAEKLNEVVEAVNKIEGALSDLGFKYNYIEPKPKWGGL